MSIPPTESGPDEKIPRAPGTNQITWFIEFHPLTQWEKKYNLLHSEDLTTFLWKYGEFEALEWKNEVCFRWKQNKTTTQDLHIRIRLTLERQTTKKINFS